MGIPLANAQTVSKVRQAAIDRMQNKLGDIRGSLKRGSSNIYLTEMMIERLRPIPTTAVATEHTSTPYAQNTELTKIYKERAKTTDELVREIYASIGLVAEQEINHNESLASADLTSSTMPNTSDINAIMRAVDRMVANGG